MKVLLIEDDQETSAYVARGLREQGHVVDLAANGRDGLFLATEGGHDVLIVDRMLPGLEGVGLVQALRGTGVKAPVLFLTALGGVGDRVRGLEAGGDDYLVKPFAFAELLARINALARRPPLSDMPALLRVADVELDLLKRRVFTDFLSDSLEVSLYASTCAFAVALGATFTIWYGIERTLSIHTIVTPRRELFYWAAILFTFALGTAAGDLATEALQLGFRLGVVIFGALIAVATASYFLGANPVLTFWIAYILTRPFGASLGDLLSQAQTYGGIGLGTIITSIAFLAVIVTLVTWLTVTGTDRTPVARTAEGR